MGVVLSGGGAKGLYHIGVLEALEREGIPIDYVAGTSIGAVVAGLYAAGYSPMHMRQIATSGELERWVSGKIDVNHGSYFRRGSTLRRNDNVVSYRLNPGADKRADSVSTMPKSLISTTQIDMAMSELFSAAGLVCEGDFSNLMVPFLCVTSDVTAGEGLILKEGDLGKSIRASIAIPLAFKPIVREDGHMLYDGGIYDNFPWRPMVEQFDPDLIIGSVCGVDSWTDTNDLSVFDQAFMLAMNHSNYDIPDEKGVVIARNVPTGMLDFSGANDIINMGYDDTIAKIDSIKMRVDSTQLKKMKYFRDRRAEFNENTPRMHFDSYEITGLNENQRHYVRNFMTTSRREQKQGANQQEVISFPELRQKLYSVLSANDFNTDYPIVSFAPESGQYQFEIGMEHKPSSRLSLGGNLSSTPFNQLYFGFNQKSIERVVRELFAELYLSPVYTTGRLGYRADFYLNAPMFIDTYFNFAVKNLNHGDFGNLTKVNNTEGIKSSEFLLSLGVGAPLKERAMILLRTNVGSESFNYDGSKALDESSFGYLEQFNKSRLRYITSKLEIERGTIDNPYLPTSGSLLTLSGMGLIGREQSFADDYSDVNSTLEEPVTNVYYAYRYWFGAKVTYTKYFDFSAKKNFILGLSLDGVFTTVPDMYNRAARQLMLPAYQPTRHSNMVYMPEFSAERYAALGLMPTVRMWKELYLRTGFYAMLRDEYDSTLNASEGKGYAVKHIIQADLTYNTTIGPISLALTKYDVSSWNNLYLTFNFGYSIFSPRGTFY
ncbi:MAG: patatin-like phospholipase family protein [Rikenellaceae bacterium]